VRHFEQDLYEPRRSRFSAAAFIVAARLVVTLWRIESNQAVNRSAEAHRVAVDHVNWTGLNGIAARARQRGGRWPTKENPRETR